MAVPQPTDQPLSPEVRRGLAQWIAKALPGMPLIGVILFVMWSPTSALAARSAAYTACTTSRRSRREADCDEH